MGDLLNATLAEARRDAATVTADGRPLAGLPPGARSRPTPTHHDDRGSLFEIYSDAWGFDEHPASHVYCFTIRPGVVKGWGLHKEHEDRYCLIRGTVRVVFYDVRPDSPTCGRVIETVMSETGRRLLSVPTHVWHADQNIGEGEAIIVNLPTRPYDHANPDKYRLPVDTPLIPFRFEGATGW